MIGSPPQGPYPPLARCKMWGMKYESLILGVPCCSRLQSTHIRPVSQFGLRITSDGFVSFRRFEEDLVLLWSTLIAESRLKNG